MRSALTLLSWLAAGGGVENGFAYTAEEASQCRNEGGALQRSKSNTLRPEVIEIYRRSFTECVLSRRAGLETAKQVDDISKRRLEERAANKRAQDEHRREEGARAAVAAEALRVRQEEQATRRADPRWMRPLLSAQICEAQRERAATVAEIARERRLARQAGVVDLSLLQGYKETLRDDDDRVASGRSDLAALKVRPLACSDKTVARIGACLSEYTPLSERLMGDACKDNEILEYAQLTKDPRDL